LSAKNPIGLVARGERAALELCPGVEAFVLRGARPGPIVWAWVPRGELDPSMQQALGELRDRLHPSELAGAVGLLLSGPPPPLEREQYAYAEAVRAISIDTSAVVLLHSLPAGYEAAPHAALELDDPAARKIARALGATYLLPPLSGPRLHRGILAAPTVAWIDGESERLSRPVIDRARTALEALLARLGALKPAPKAGSRTHAVRVALKRLAEVEAPYGVVEPAVQPGELVRTGQVVAWVGEPGLATRQPLRAPTSGVVLYVRSGRVPGGPVIGVGKLRRALPLVRARARADGALELGWCERVALPDLGVPRLEAKIDTGARTSALHVSSLVPAGTSAAGRPLYQIGISAGRRRSPSVTARVEVVEHTLVRDSGGHAERRPVIETSLVLGDRPARRVRVSLTDRGDMRFPMLVGRTALPPSARIHPGRRWLLG
jgi:hypothetical protein